jgi:hypothetical protein
MKTSDPTKAVPLNAVQVSAGIMSATHAVTTELTK